ncbi:MAG: hypothetical protein WCA04_07815, partial [Geobacteraceae bacterium]
PLICLIVGVTPTKNTPEAPSLQAHFLLFFQHKKRSNGVKRPDDLLENYLECALLCREPVTSYDR